MDKYRVVFHLDEADRVRTRMALKNIENLIVDLGGENVEVELVANGEGVIPLLKGPNELADQIAKLAGKGVRFAACANSLRQMQLTEDALLEAAEVVPTGVGELVQKQAEGWAYIRP